MSRVFSTLVPVWVTVTYATVLGLVSTVLWVLGPEVRDRVVGHLSTNVENLGHGHVGTLLGSAFVTAEGPIYPLLPGLVCLLALAELLWRGRRLVQAFMLGHVGATLIVAAGLAAAIRAGWLPLSTAGATDVGLSYGAVGVLGALTAAMPTGWRPAWAGGWLTVAWVVASMSGWDFTAVGHAVALVLGMLLSTRLHADAHWSALRRVLLGVGIAFGLLLLVGSWLSTAPAAVPAGLGVALLALWPIRDRRRSSRTDPIHGKPVAQAISVTSGRCRQASSTGATASTSMGS